MLSPTLLVVIIGGAVLLIGVGIALEVRARDQTPSSSGGFNPTVMIVLIVLFGGALLVLYPEIAKLSLRNQYGSTLANMCENTVFADFSRNNLTSTHTPLRFLVLDDEGKRHSWHNQLPDEMQAKDQTSTDVVACVMSKKHEQLMETCRYQSYTTGKFFTVWRVQYYQNVYLVDAATGKPVAALVAWGSGPEYCPDSLVTSDFKLRGSSPKYTYFYDALAGFLNGN